MTESMSPTYDPPADPELMCPVCGSTSHTTGHHDSSEPSGYHDASVVGEAIVNEK